MFQELVDSLQDKVRSSNDFEYGTKFRRKDKALEFKYIEHNQLYKKYLVVDVDTPQSTYLWEDVNLPPPTMITISPDTARCHYLWQLNTPVIYTEAGRTAPQRFYENVDIALTHAIPGADQSYVGKFIKNPTHNYWKTIYHPISYDLEDFDEYLDITPSRKKKEALWNSDGRNSTLFDQLRYWAYTAVKTSLNYEAFQSETDRMALSLNLQFQTLTNGVLMAKEVLSTARSVGKWTWRHKNDNYKNRGILNLPDDMAINLKQREGALYKNKKQANSTTQKIFNSVQCLKVQGTVITQKSVSVHSGLSIDSIKRNWKGVVDKFHIYTNQT